MTEMSLDPVKYATLTALVRDARAEDAKAFKAMEAANAAWKDANAILTDRNKVLDGYIAQVKAEDTRP